MGINSAIGIGIVQQNRLIKIRNKTDMIMNTKNVTQQYPSSFIVALAAVSLSPHDDLLEPLRILEKLKNTCGKNIAHLGTLAPF